MVSELIAVLGLNLFQPCHGASFQGMISPLERYAEKCLAFSLGETCSKQDIAPYKSMLGGGGGGNMFIC